MTYDSLLLNFGGGIINDAKKSKQFAGSAALCIGIGGTGVAALSDLKGKIYQQLEPDNPGEPIPKYDAIQLMAIDSDDTAYKTFRGNCRLSENEFFSIKKDNLAALFQGPKGKALIMGNPQMDWMEIEKINKLLSPEGAGGIRQMGRYLLMSKASSLISDIQAKCLRALQVRNSNSLDIYIFAGISGGTGSGCFLDTCYLVRHVVETNGWNAKIMGYFFLPDVVTSKPAVASNPASVAYNNSNGYAAMKELDYLMSLKDADDWFDQNYGSGIRVHTQEPPVDMCHLISAQKADGRQIPNGFGYGINVASDYAMAYLADVDLGGKDGDESGLTMRGHLANVTRGVLGIPRRWGANLSYHILGASNAEIPMTQINTYLAIGFFRKFHAAMRKPKNVITKSVIASLVESLRFRARDVYNDVIAGTPMLDLPDTDRKMLAKMPLCPKGRLPESWATPGNAWLDDCDGVMVRNANALTRELDSFDYDKINDQSLIGRLFRRLYDMSMDPNFGPYYAASLLNNSGEDLISALAGEVATAEGQQHSQQIQIDPMGSELVEYNQYLIDKNGNQKSYSMFYNGALRYYQTNNAVIQCAKTAQVLRDFKGKVQELYDSFFKPLCEMLDNLRDTFEENASYLQLPESREVNAYTWQILTLDEVQKRLDDAVEALNEKQLIDHFVGSLLRQYPCWLKGDQDKITLMIKNYMLSLFAEETDRSLQDYLGDKFPKAKGNAIALAQEIEENILKKVNASAVPMFWCDPTYELGDPTYTFESSSLSVPSVSSVVCNAADSFGNNYQNYAVRKTGISDRIFALRFVSGIPLFAYHGITLLKGDYDAAGNSAAGAGSHLYAYTGRGKDGSGMKDWRNYLPTPMPYSKVRQVDANMIPEAKNLVALYKDAVARGIIGLVPEYTGDGTSSGINETYAIFTSPEYQPREYTLKDFLVGDNFSVEIFDQIRSEVARTLENQHKFGTDPACGKIELKNDGDPALCQPEDVRMDYFIHYPMLHKVVRKEIAKDQALKDTLAQIDAIRDEYVGYDADLGNFASLLFDRGVQCRDSAFELNYDRTAFVTCAYQDRYGEEKTFYLSEKTMPYGKEFPLFQAFLTYREVLTNDDLKPIRRSLETTLADNVNKIRGMREALVAAILEQVWDNAAMEELTNVTVKSKSAEDQKAIVRFYSSLRANIKSYKDDLSVWPKDRSVQDMTNELVNPAAAAETTTAATTPVAPPPMDQVLIWSNGENITLYPAQSMNYAWSGARGWVPLDPGMYVAKNGQWVPIQLDAQGRIIL